MTEDRLRSGPSSSCGRIESIDVLRAVVLLGILTVHSFGGFGLRTEQAHSIISDFVILFLNDKCNPAFCMLFGLSFYLILRKPGASSWKFVWRCFLLVCFGVINKFFYWYDVLSLYGVIGMALVLFRNLGTRALALCAASIYFLYLYMEPLFHVQSLLFPEGVDVSTPQGATFGELVDRPIVDGFKAYIYYIAGHSGCGLKNLSMALAGYTLGKWRVTERLGSLMRARTLALLWVCAVSTLIARYKVPWPEYLAPLKAVDNLCACITYCYSVLYVYYRLNGHRWLGKLAPYGNMGLTNYSMQGMAGVFLFSASGLSLSRASGAAILAFVTIFYSLQLLASRWWMRRMLYGPWEWAWRSATNLKLLPIRRS